MVEVGEVAQTFWRQTSPAESSNYDERQTQLNNCYAPNVLTFPLRLPSRPVAARLAPLTSATTLARLTLLFGLAGTLGAVVAGWLWPRSTYSSGA